MRGGLVARGGGRNPDGATTKANRFFDFALGAFGDVERDEADRQQALIMRTEIDHRAIERAGSAVEQVGIVLLLGERAPELPRRDRGEHELTIEAEHIERAGPFGRIGRAVGVPALQIH